MSQEEDNDGGSDAIDEGAILCVRVCVCVCVCVCV